MTSADSARGTRTRRDVVVAAVEAWAADNTASLGAVAAAAGVGRTTLHRYFPDREALIAAVDRECWERFNAATNRARIDQGTGADALRRLLLEVSALGPVLGLTFADNALIDPETWQTETRPDPFVVVVLRGQDDGSLAADVPAEWAVIQCWTSLFGAHLAAQSDGELRHRAGELVGRTLLRGLGG